MLVLFATTSLMMPRKLLLFLSYSHALTVETLFLAGLPQPLVGKLQRVQNSTARLVVRAPPHVHVTPVLRHLHWLPVRARISYQTAYLCSNDITSSTLDYLSDYLHLGPYARCGNSPFPGFAIVRIEARLRSYVRAKIALGIAIRSGYFEIRGFPSH